jgi:hypothetical protein
MQYTTGGTDCAEPTPTAPPEGSDSGGGTDGSEPAPPPDADTEEGSTPTTDCTPSPAVTEGLCIPAVLRDYGVVAGSDSKGEAGSEDGSTTGSGAPAPPQDPIDEDAGKPTVKGDDGGCSVAPALGASSGGWLSGLLLLAPLAARLGRRRR